MDKGKILAQGGKTKIAFPWEGGQIMWVEVISGDNFVVLRLHTKQVLLYTMSRFWQYGRWVEVVVDDYLPTIDNNLAFIQSDSRLEIRIEKNIYRK